MTSDYTDKALLETCRKTDAVATDYLCAPITYSGGNTRGAYEWVIGFVSPPKDEEEFAKILDQELCNIHSYYFDERFDTKVLGAPKLNIVTQ